MIVLHTSDWHLGRTLYGRARYKEQEAFLDWLVNCLNANSVDVLLAAGDIFDSAVPSNRAQELYYRFLQQVARSSCRHVVIIAGNHDSPSFLSASRSLLRVLDIHVISASTENSADELILLKNESGKAELLVGAVPYLRERDVRFSSADDSLADKERNLREGIRRHYEAVAATAEEIRHREANDLPFVLMGHLFVNGGRTIEGDGVRDLYVGSLAHAPSSIFPSSAAYVALGHLHAPQKVSGAGIIRYSGSPIPMGFSEAKQEKSVSVVSIANGAVDVRLEPVPVFQRLECIGGNEDCILSRVKVLVEQGESIWVEIMHEGGELVGDFRSRLEEIASGTCVEILRVSSRRLAEHALSQKQATEKLQDLHPMEVFERCLAARNVPEEQRDVLHNKYQEVLHSLMDEGRL